MVSKSTLYGIAIFLLIVGGGVFMVKGDSGQGVSGNVVAVGTGDAQELSIGMKDYNYYPETVTVDAGKPVRLQLDDSVYGCFRDLVVRGTNIKKYLATPNDVLEFTIDKPGTYTFACSMGMGAGKLIVQ